jgi:hypothetical protein
MERESPDSPATGLTKNCGISLLRLVYSYTGESGDSRSDLDLTFKAKDHHSIPGLRPEHSAPSSGGATHSHKT